MSIQLALQLYSLRDYKTGRFPEVLRKVKEAGYDGVEFAGFHGFGAPELKSLLDSIGLKSEGSHTDLGLLEKEPDEVIRFNLALKTPYIIIPYAPLETEEDYLKAAEFCNRMGAKIGRAGMKLLYHNHGAEFKRLPCGRTGLQILRDNTSPETLGFQLDVYWARFAGFSPSEVMREFGKRCVTVHLKDMAEDGKTMTEVGTGVIDTADIIREGKSLGIEWFTVEQDEISIDPIRSISVSAANVRKLA